MPRNMKVSLDDVRLAEKAIRSFILHTPLEHSGSASFMASSDIFIKLENFQLTGSFKIRGAANKLLSLSSEEKKRGVVAASAGNHAQGVACMAKKLGIKATIVMPENSPLIKIAST